MSESEKTTRVEMPTGHQLAVLEHRARAHNFATWERESLRAICDLLRPGMVVYDVGAEEGEFSALYGQIVGPGGVHLFEPTPSVWPNIHAAWHANHAALPGGTWPGFVSTSAHSRWDGSERGHWPDGKAHPWRYCVDGPIQGDSRFSVVTERPDIPSISLDEYADMTGTTPDVVVVDVEGAELLVVDGSVGLMWGDGNRPTFAVSVHPPEFLSRFPCPMGGGACTQEMLFRFFSDHGYDARHIWTDHESHWVFTPRERD